MKKSIYVLVLFTSVLFGACTEETDPITGANPPGLRKLFVLNEGRFYGNNASLDVWNYTDTVPSLNVVPNLGDVGNDIITVDSAVYIVLNGSRKVVVLGADSLEALATISFGSETPNRIMQTTATEAFVTKYYASDIAVLDLVNMNITEVIPIATETKAMDISGANVYVITDSTGYAVIDAGAKSVKSRITAGDYPVSIVADEARNQIVLLSQGSYYRSTPAVIHFINMTTNAVIDSIVIGGGDYIASLIDAGDKGYLLYSDRVAILDYATKSISNGNFIAKPYYGGIYDKDRDELILGTAKDFQSNDVVEIYDASTGALKNSFGAGIAPGRFAIYKKQ